MNNPVARILDVNLNRAGEALRTLEEYARFVVNSPALSGRCKTLRHDLALVARAWSDARKPEDRPLANRDIAGDVGAAIKTSAEGVRPDARSVAAAAARRAAEALRALSEYAKIDDPAMAGEFERIRYGVYDVEPVLLADGERRRRLADARLCVTIVSALCGGDAPGAARQALAGGADVISLREEEMGDAGFHRLAADLADVCRTAGALFIIHGRPHIADLVDADGVLGSEDDLPGHLLRRLLGADKLIGRTASAPESAKDALAGGADYIAAGPVFETAAGPDFLTWASAWGALPCFAGGVTRDSLDAVIRAGARAVAVDGAVTRARDIAAEAAFFKERLNAAARSTDKD